MLRRPPLLWLALTLLLVATVVAAALVLRTEQGYAAARFAWTKIRGAYTVDDRLQMHASDVEARLRPKFEAAGLSYPPHKLAYLAFKDQAVLEVYAQGGPDMAWQRVHSYPILGMSGTQGPKLREGDLQVPEGIYRAEFLNANSRFHLSIRLSYPNAFDLKQAQADGRSQLGSDIMIHGTKASIGCLAMGNQAAEDLFILAALAGKEQLEIVVAPTDFRRHQVLPSLSGSPAWLPELHRDIQAALSAYP